MFGEFFVGSSLSLLLGALIGAQREVRIQKSHVKDFAGFRTFAFGCLLGFLLGYLAFEVVGESWIIVLSIFNIFVISAIAYYVLSKTDPLEIAMTTEMTFVLTFVLGVFISLKYYQISTTLAIVIATILVLGEKLHFIAKHLKNKEIFATLKFAIISLVVLPILPNMNYTLFDFPILGELLKNQSWISQSLILALDVFNFYHMWIMVVFISGIGFVGYFLMKVLGSQRGILLTGFLGGFMSSTALTTSFSQESSKSKSLANPLAIGVIIACSTMFFRIIFEVIVLNKNLLYGLTIPLGIMGFVGFALALYLFFKYDKKSVKVAKEEKLTSPFTLAPALEFALLYLMISFFSKLFTLIRGDSGIYILSFISGITDVDAITISLSTLALNLSISSNVAQMGIIIAAMTNTIFKGAIVYYLGSKPFFHKIFYVFTIILLFGGIVLLL